LLVLCGLLLGSPRLPAQQATDTLVERVQQLVNLGNRSAARSLADSALMIRTAGTEAYAEALYARALATSDAGSAERDYLRVGIEYPLSSRAQGAMMMAGQLKMSRGNRAGARAIFERIVLDFPGGAQSFRASYWAGRLALEDGDVARGCRWLQVSSETTPAADVEFRNQVEYLRATCMMPGAPLVTSDTTPAMVPVETPAADAAEPQPATEYSVQVAAYSRKRDADATLNRLRARGFPVRIVGTRAPYRVRVGWYPTRAAAQAAQGRMRRAGVTGIVVEAEPR
jgi:hypothetical protein